jgi:hypothetical protein
VLVRVDHIASFIVNADHGIMRSGPENRLFENPALL